MFPTLSLHLRTFLTVFLTLLFIDSPCALGLGASVCALSIYLAKCEIICFTGKNRLLIGQSGWRVPYPKCTWGNRMLSEADSDAHAVLKSGYSLSCCHLQVFIRRVVVLQLQQV